MKSDIKGKEVIVRVAGYTRGVYIGKVTEFSDDHIILELAGETYTRKKDGVKVPAVRHLKREHIEKVQVVS